MIKEEKVKPQHSTNKLEQEMISNCKSIEEKIMLLESDMKNIDPVGDGIVNIGEYINSKYKILWILKESNDVRKSYDGSGLKGGGWHLNKALDKLGNWASQPKTGNTTIRRMIKAYYIILNKLDEHIDWTEIDLNDSNVFQTLKQIAVINVKKIPGGYRITDRKVQEAYNKNRDLLKLQIDTYNPDIVIILLKIVFIFRHIILLKYLILLISFPESSWIIIPNRIIPTIGIPVHPVQHRISLKEPP